jgi:hypothetical protein
MKITGIDPGSEQTALVIFDNSLNYILFKEIVANHLLIKMIVENMLPEIKYTKIVIEKVASYGMPVGESVFQTVRWYGRFEQALSERTNDKIEYITRNEVKNILCHSSRANDSNIRQALIDRLGKPGTKKKPGVTYGITKDLWAALAVAIAFSDRIK